MTLLLREEDYLSIESSINKQLQWKSKFLFYSSGFLSLPMNQRLKVEYKVRRYENGKEVEKKYLKKFTEAFPLVLYKR